ncbi:hypothetical protein AAF712_008164 [Marasmius tenuissimus]|uniref:Uncharacterized protein n=1 Tax=Marasmius tenuissimus TaxID=585030 RepID=A0ABR2ZUT9_9AGAR
MTRLGIDTAAITAARWARTQQQHQRPVDSPENLNINVHPATMVSDVENMSNSPVVSSNIHGYGHGLQRFASNTSVGPPERPLSRVDEENDNNDNGDERSMSSDSDPGSDTELEMELEEEGFYAGSYPRLLALYALAPLTFLILFILFALVPQFLPLNHNHPEPPYTPNLPFPIPETLISGGVYTITYTLNPFIFTISTWFCTATKRGILYLTRPPHYRPQLTITTATTTAAVVLSSLVYATLSIIMRVVTIQLLGIPSSTAPTPAYRSFTFVRAWWAGLGWALFEAVAGVWQGYRAIEAYKDVLVDMRRVKALRDVVGGGSRPGDGEREDTGTVKGYGATISDANPGSSSSDTNADDDATPTEDENTNRGRLPRVPTASDSDPERQPLLSGLGGSQHHHYLSHSRDSMDLLNLGQSSHLVEIEVERDLDQLMALRERDELERVYGVAFVKIPIFITCLQRVNSLLLSMGLTLVLAGASDTTSPSSPNPPIRPLPVFLLILFQLTLYLLHSEIALPRIGVHTVVYVGFMTSLGMFFGGLGVWGVVS